MKVGTPPYIADIERAEQFAALLDPNPAHLGAGGNILYDYKYLSGLYLLCLSNRAVLALPSFASILCGRDAHVRFIRPCKPGVQLFTSGFFTSHAHPTRPNVEERRCHLEVLLEDAPSESVLSYSITQLFEVR